MDKLSNRMTNIKGVFGAFFFVNLTAGGALLSSDASTLERFISGTNVLFAIAAVYFAFKLEALNITAIKYTVLLAVVFTVITSLMVGAPLVWLVLYVAVSLYLLVNLQKASGEPAVTPQPQPVQNKIAE